MRISVLFWEWLADGVLKHDEVVDQLQQALVESGHEATLLGITSDLKYLVDKLEEQKPDLVFNLVETFADNDAFEMNIAAVLQMLGVRFTGSSARVMAVRQDKGLTKKLLAFHDVRCPQFATFDHDNIEFAGKMRFPLLVKPLHGDASAGVHDSSLVNDFRSLVERIAYIHTELRDTALVEEYIDGREFYVSVLGNDPPEVLPLIEMDFSALPAGYPHIYGREAKFDEKSVHFAGTNAVVATDLPPELRHRIELTGRAAAQAMEVSDYARVDIRVARDGTPYVVEVNANPYLEQTAAIAIAALQAGYSYRGLIGALVEIAWERWERSDPKRRREKAVVPAPVVGENGPQRVAEGKVRAEADRASA
ncbi:MAG TPA: ATP-grasp domain-containing protein [Anaerolineales bacterium]|nr:ATP-grasp domain-containing protein [Anaerolineales bacterium]